MKKSTPLAVRCAGHWGIVGAKMPLERPPVAALIASALAAVVCCFVPLFDVIGYESAAAAGLACGLIAAFSTAIRTPAVPQYGPWDRYLAALPGLLLVVPVALAVVGANALRVRNCDPLGGLVWWLWIPPASVVFGHALGLVAATLSARRRVRLAVVLVVLLAEIGWVLYGLYAQPPIQAYEWFIGWFSGSIYDEALSLSATLKTWRAVVVAMGIGAVLILELVWRRRVGRPLLGVVLACGAVWGPLVWVGTHAQSFGFAHDRDYIARKLGGELHSEHFVIHFDPNALGEEGRARLIEDHEFRYAQHQAFFEEDPVAWRGRPIHSFVYPGSDRQQKLMGAYRTLVARPWSHEMHVRWDGLGDDILAHELAHLFTSPFGGGPLRLATRGGVIPDIGLVEGIAEAANWGPSELSPHDVATALRAQDKAPNLRKLLGPGGFWTQPAGKAYTLMASFVRWLVQAEGMDAFKKVYGSGDFDGVYGRSAVDLVGEWETWIDARQVDDAQLELARYKYRKGSIFKRVCARTLASLNRGVGRARNRSDLDRAIRLQRDVLDIQPGKPGHVRLLAELLHQAGDDGAALAALDGLLETKLKPSERTRLEELKGDILWQSGGLLAAEDVYEGCLVAGLPDSSARRLAVKSEVLAGRDPVSLGRGARYMLGGLNTALMLYTAREWAAERPDDPLPRYLVGLRLHRLDEDEEAAVWLAGDPGLHPDPRVDEQRRLLLGRSLSRLGPTRYSEARGVLDELSSATSPRVRRAAAEELERLDWKEGTQ